MTRIIIAGAAGRMGKALIRCALQMPSLRLVGATEAAGHPDLGADAGALAGERHLGVPLGNALEAIIAEADVVIDFTLCSVVPANARCAAEAGKALVIGTTGLSDAEAGTVREAARRVPVVWAPNMSLGVNLLFALVERAARLLGPEYDVEIVEMHHRHKRDAPSGTALRLGEAVAQGRGKGLEAPTMYGRHGQTGDRPRGAIAIHALRGGDVVGDHTVVFAADGERVELGHRATSRDAFAMGALRAAAWVAGRAPGLYDMKDVLGL